MKLITTFLLLVICFEAFGQTTYEDWEKESETNIRLLPKYGNLEKTKEQKESDQLFIDEMLQVKEFKGNRKLASKNMIDVGFKYLYQGDLKTAMYRFNQAYLLDDKNSDIYWGFGAVYMSLLNYEKAKEQYEEGLKIDPKNHHLLTDLGTYYLSQFYSLSDEGDKNAKDNLNLALEKLNQSYEINSKDQNTLYKLSICYMLNKDCKNAWKYYEACKKEGGKPITKEYTEELKRSCKNNKEIPPSSE